MNNQKESQPLNTNGMSVAEQRYKESQNVMPESDGVMGNVDSFSSVMSVINIIINIALVIAVVITGMVIVDAYAVTSSHFLPLLIIAVTWVVKTLLFGMAFCSIATADNTKQTNELLIKLLDK